MGPESWTGNITRAPISRLRVLAFQDKELLTEGDVLQDQAAASTKSAKDDSAPEQKQFKHGSNVIADQRFACLPKLLISRADGVVTRHTESV